MPPSNSQKPELIFGLVGPIGCDIVAVEKSLSRALKRVDYTPVSIRVSDAIPALLSLRGAPPQPLGTLSEKILGGNEVRRLFDNNAIFAAEVIRRIRQCRLESNKDSVKNGQGENDPSEVPIDATAYIIRQLKRPEEVALLRRTYGQLFIQISVTHSREGRFNLLVDRTRRDSPGWTNTQCEDEARRLIQVDENEEDVAVEAVMRSKDHGQKLTEIFHLGDAFISSESEKSSDEMCIRFVDALFGKTNISPTRDEFGSYMAKAASLRSVDLSRQVGAAILTQEGDIISVGCNDVPKPGGGIYWDEDFAKSRDVDRKGEANKEETNRIIFDFLRTLQLNEVFKDGQTPETILGNSDLREAILGSLIGEITEYGRMVHAEMGALTDAARLGRSVKDATLFVTTYPCHNCAKHIIASGIKRVVFIEPYPKSRAELLYIHAIATEQTAKSNKVAFQHFQGISPLRYRDIFEKGKRRSKSGEVFEWYQNTCVPRVGPLVHSYWLTERHAIDSAYPPDETGPATSEGQQPS